MFRNRKIVQHVPVKMLSLIAPCIIVTICASIVLTRHSRSCDSREVWSEPESRKLPSEIAGRILKQKAMTSTLENMFTRLILNIVRSYNNSTPVFSYICDTECETGGKYEYGLVSTFMLSLLFNRRFTIEPTDICSIFNVYQPNLLDWTPRQTDGRDHSTGVKRRQLPFFEKNFEITDLNEKYQSDIVYFEDNKDGINSIRRHYKTYEVFPWVHLMPYSDIIRLVNIGLFRAAGDTFQTTMHTALTHQTGDDQLVCVHGDVSSANVEQILSYLELTYVKPGYRFYFSLNNNSHNIANEEMFRDKVVRMDINMFPEAGQCPAAFQQVLDEYILRLCHVLVVTDSPAGSRVAHMRGDSVGLFCCSKTGDVYPCRRELMRLNFRNTELNTL